MKRIRSRRGKPNVSRLLAGATALALALGVYLPHSPLRIVSIAAAEAVQRTIGSMGWQPDARVFLFHVPFHRQEHALSCEVASLTSVLRSFGLDVPESELLSALPKDPTPKSGNALKGYVWGDPDKGFVGNVDGRMPGTGYGVFIGPLRSVADRYASSSVIDVRDTHAIDDALHDGHPIIAWHVLGSHPSIMQWRTPDGTVVNAPLYEHTFVIVGYRGTSDAIEGVYVVDPITSLRYVPWEEFLWRTSFFEHQGLEVWKR